MEQTDKRRPGAHGPEGDASPGDIAERELTPARPVPGSPFAPHEENPHAPPRDRNREAPVLKREEEA